MSMAFEPLDPPQNIFLIAYLNNGRNPEPGPSNEREWNLTAGFATGIRHENLMERLLAFYETGRRNE